VRARHSATPCGLPGFCARPSAPLKAPQSAES
jgi:hypothetical protein